MFYKSNIVLLLLLSTISTFSYSQDLITDRPDQTESSVTVPKGSLQWESGFWFEKDTKSMNPTNSQIQSLGFNSSLLRYGIFKNIELRFGYNLVQSRILSDISGQWESVSTSTDLEPMYAGAKIKLLNESGIIPELAILGHFSIPRLSTITDSDIASDITLSGSYTLTNSIGFGFNMGSHWSGFGIEYRDWFYSAVLGISHGEKLSSYWEVYGWNYAIALIEGKDVRLDSGITYLLKPNLQLDLSGGIGLSDISPDYFINIGFSWRIPE